MTRLSLLLLLLALVAAVVVAQRSKSAEPGDRSAAARGKFAAGLQKSLDRGKKLLRDRKVHLPKRNKNQKAAKGSPFLQKLKEVGTKGAAPLNWRQMARQFCRHYPGHQACKGGKRVEFAQIQAAIAEVEKNPLQFLKKVPKLRIKDPLESAGLPAELKEVGKKLKFGRVNDEDAVKKLTGVCRGKFKCRGQRQEIVEKKTQIFENLVAYEQTEKDDDDEAEAVGEDIDLRMDRVLQIKQALLEKANLTGEVDPADDGVLDSDLLLTEAQSNFLLNELGKGDVGADPYDDLPQPGDEAEAASEAAASGSLGPAAQAAEKARRKRASIFFEENPVQMWDVKYPIPYAFDESLEEFDKNDVRDALAELSKRTCIRFQYYATKPANQPHLYYMKVDSPTFCGLSYVGKVSPSNPIYLSFQCGNSIGVAVHETMHALGVGHQHLRPDRDQHIQIDWSNVIPQHYDYFAVSDSKLYTTYGTPYAYDSIMHYNAYTAAIDISKPTMLPKIDYANNVRQLGQRNYMSVRDVEILRKMYCMPGCVDRNVYCGAWALKNLCTAPAQLGWMQQNCQKSCGFCGSG